MFLRTLSALVFLVVIANSDQQLRQIESRVSRGVYEALQDIKNLVPVDFAANNLRKSRLKNRDGKNLLSSHQSVTTVPKVLFSSTSRRFRPTKSPNVQSTEANRKAGKSSGKKPNKTKIVTTTKPSRFNDDKSSNSYNSTNVIVEKTTISPKVDKKLGPGGSRFRTHSRNGSSRASGRKSEDSFASIKKAINTLPQQTVQFVRDENVDCTDNAARKSNDTRTPPCTLSVKWPGSTSGAWFSMSNVISRKWGRSRN